MGNIVGDSERTKSNLHDQILSLRPEVRSETSPVQCEANIDSVNGATPSPTPLAISNRLTVRGWTTISGRNGTVPDEVFLTLSKGGETLYATTRTTPRPDVTEHFGHLKMPDAGFTADLHVLTLNGSHSVGLSTVYKAKIDGCQKLNIAAINDL